MLQTVTDTLIAASPHLPWNSLYKSARGVPAIRRLSLVTSTSTIRLRQDRRSGVLESRTVRVSEGPVCGLQYTVSTGKIVPFLAGWYLCTASTLHVDIYSLQP